MFLSGSFLIGFFSVMTSTGYGFSLHSPFGLNPLFIIFVHLICHIETSFHPFYSGIIAMILEELYSYYGSIRLYDLSPS